MNKIPNVMVILWEELCLYNNSVREMRMNMSREKHNSGVWKVLLGIFVIAALIIWFFTGSYNRLVREEESVNKAFSNISVQLQRRNDLIPNLVNTVKGYAAHETDVFTAVTDAREHMLSASTVRDAAAADTELSNSLGRLLAIAEAYPELKANENFLSLQDQLEGTENRIGTSRRDYNEAVNLYNTEIRTFPRNIIANLWGFEKHELFTADEGAQEVPDVDFSR